MAEKNSDQKQILLLPPAIDDWVSADDPVRLISTIIAKTNLQELGISEQSGSSIGYSKRMLLSIWVFAYFCRIRSCRAVESACRENLRFLWLTGMNAPDHNTLWRFFKDHKASFPRFLKKTIQLCCEMGLVRFALHAIDGTRIPSVSSNSSGWHKNALSKALAKMDESILKMLNEIEKAGPGTDEGQKLKAEMTDEIARAEWVEKKLALLEQGGLNNLNPNEPDVKVIKTMHGLMFGYNSQAAVDAESGVVVAGSVYTVGNDNHLMNSVMDEIEQSTNRIAEITVADSGYYSTEEVEACARRGRHVVIAMQSDIIASSKRKTGDIVYDESRDVGVCPRGTILKRKGKSRGKDHLPRYECERGHECMCKPASQLGPRTFGVSKFAESTAEMVNRIESPEGQVALRKRKASIELLFAQIKSNMGFRRYSFRGKAGANAQWTLLLAIVNLQKMIKFIQKAANGRNPGGLLAKLLNELVKLYEQAINFSRN